MYNYLLTSVYLQLAVGDEGAGEGDAADVGAQEEGRLDGVGGGVRGEVGEVVQVRGDAREHGSSADQAGEPRGS